ncbi:MAG: hypothetical protein KDC14_03550, partial [Planctomycetes bacterium]|nr:hypothetical protein [Planctomycetota bacterium]
RAFDINEDNLISEHLHPDYEHSDAVRRRRALVAYHAGVLVGVALCELGSPDLSLFNLLNLAQVYTTSDVPPELNATLFREVRAFYARLGIYDPVLVAPPAQFQNPGAAGLRLDETMGCIIWSGETLEQYHNYIQYCFEKISGHSITRKTS